MGANLSRIEWISKNSGAASACTFRCILSRMPALRALPLAFVLTTLVAAQQTISFPTQDGGRIYADLYGNGARAVVLAHGGRFNKESWRDQARALVSNGFRVVAIDFRGFGRSSG